VGVCVCFCMVPSFSKPFHCNYRMLTKSHLYVDTKIYEFQRAYYVTE